MIIERTMHPRWLSNTYLVADRPGGHGVFIDSGADPTPLLERVQAEGIQITHVLCTHRHIDHIWHNTDLVEATGACVAAHSADADHVKGATRRLEDGERIRSGALDIEVLHIPGHTAGQIALLVDETDLFTGDTLFHGSIGGCVGPGHTTFEDLHHSLMDVLFTLPHRTRVHPGHTDPTTIGREWDENPFVRIMRGIDPRGNTPCTVRGEPATLILDAPDYDGGTKAWVHMAELGDLIVPGSVVEHGGAND